MWLFINWFKMTANPYWAQKIIAVSISRRRWKTKLLASRLRHRLHLHLSCMHIWHSLRSNIYIPTTINSGQNDCFLPVNSHFYLLCLYKSLPSSIHCLLKTLPVLLDMKQYLYTAPLGKGRNKERGYAVPTQLLFNDCEYLCQLPTGNYPLPPLNLEGVRREK